MVRGYVVHVTGKDGKRVTVPFDRYGLNAHVFNGRTDDQALNHAVSGALRAAMERHGTDWVDTYKVVTVPAH